ncbi:MAG: ABC transporter substrate-binding protein [Bacteroidetes bacterium]|nr:ABC transporter substrate-binding protein [Bacteroidota bacterium]
MNKIGIITSFSLALIFSSCGGGSKGDEKSGSELKGGAFAGGILRVNEVENIKSLMPISINEQNSYHIATQVYEGLVKYNHTDLSLKPCIAKSWDVNADQTEYVFHLRSNVVFHNDPCFPESKGRKVLASDVKYCLEMACTAGPNNNQFEVTLKDRIEGANECFEATKNGKTAELKGVTVINDTTLKIKLYGPDACFLSILAMPGCYIYPKEAVAKYGNDMRVKAVGTGPFYIENVKEGDVIIMKKNQNYWAVDENDNKLPYLDGIKWTFIKEKKTEILEFKRGNLDMMYRIPVEMFGEIFGKLEDAKNNKENEFQIINSVALNTFLLGFNIQANPVFAKKEVRLAFNYAIDRHKIADFTIQGEGESADYGAVPKYEVFEKAGYPYSKIKGYTFDPAKAKELMKQAGYADGKGFPEVTLEINSGGGDRNILVAEVIKSMLEENIKVKVNINTVPFPEHIENMQTAKTDFFRYGWIADYPDPESFMPLFISTSVPKTLQEKSYLNIFRYKNAKFDSLVKVSRKEADKVKRFDLLAQAEQVVLDDAPFMPIFYDENFRLEHNNVRNLPENAMNFMDMTTTYLIPPDKMPKKK